MKMVSKSLVLMALLLGMFIQAAQAKKDTAQLILDQKLFHAAAAGSKDRVRILLLQGANPNWNNDFYSSTSLLSAIKNCHADVVELLLCQRADVNQITGSSNPLNLAVGMLDINANSSKPECSVELCLCEIKLLLYHGADPNKLLNNYTPFGLCLERVRLNSACIFEFSDPASLYNAMRLLLKYGVDDTVVDKSGKTIHDYVRTDPKLQKMLEEHAKEVNDKVEDAIPCLSHDLVRVVGQYVICPKGSKGDKTACVADTL